MSGYYTPPPGGGSGGAAGSLQTTGAPVVVSGAAPPAVGDVLTATSATTADWESPGALVNNLKIATVTLSGAQLAAINSTPVTAIARQGANKWIQVVPVASAYVNGQFLVGSTPYTKYGDLFIRLTIEDQASLSASVKINDDLGADIAGNLIALLQALGAKANFSNLAVQVQADPDVSTGRITASNVTSGNAGLGFAPGDTFTDNAIVGDGNAAYVVDTVDGLGAVLTFHLTAQGTGYAPANGISTNATSGIGTGLKIDITAIQSVGDGDGTLTLTIPYIVVTLQ